MVDNLRRLLPSPDWSIHSASESSVVRDAIYTYLEVGLGSDAAGVSGLCEEPSRCSRCKKEVQEIRHRLGFGSSPTPACGTLQRYISVNNTDNTTLSHTHKKTLFFYGLACVPGPGWSLALSSSLDVCPLELESTSLTPESAGLGGSEPGTDKRNDSVRRRFSALSVSVRPRAASMTEIYDDAGRGRDVDE